MLGDRLRARDGNDGAVLLAYCCFLGHVLGAAHGALLSTPAGWACGLASACFHSRPHPRLLIGRMATATPSAAILDCRNSLFCTGVICHPGPANRPPSKSW